MPYFQARRSAQNIALVTKSKLRLFSPGICPRSPFMRVQVFPKAYLALSVLSAIRASSAPLRILSAAKALTQQFVCSWIAGSATFRLTVCNLFLERCKPASGGPRPAKSQVAHIRHQPHDPEFQVCFAPAYSFNGIGSGRGLAYDFRTFTDHSCC